MRLTALRHYLVVKTLDYVFDHILSCNHLCNCIADVILSCNHLCNCIADVVPDSAEQMYDAKDETERHPEMKVSIHGGDTEREKRGR